MSSVESVKLEEPTLSATSCFNLLLDGVASYFNCLPSDILTKTSQDYVFMRRVLLQESFKAITDDPQLLAILFSSAVSSIYYSLEVHEERLNEASYAECSRKASEALSSLAETVLEWSKADGFLSELEEQRQSQLAQRRKNEREARAAVMAEKRARRAELARRRAMTKQEREAEDAEKRRLKREKKNALRLAAKAERKAEKSERLQSRISKLEVRSAERIRYQNLPKVKRGKAKRSRGCPNKPRLATHIFSVMVELLKVTPEDLRKPGDARDIALYLARCLSSCQVEELAALHYTSPANVRSAVWKVRARTWEDYEFNERINELIIRAAPLASVALDSRRQEIRETFKAVQGDLL